MRDAEADLSALIARAVSGDRASFRGLVDALTPVIHASVARRLLRARGGGGWDARQEVRDFVQQVFVALFDDGARVLRQWDPARGRSLTSYVSLVAEREVLSILRSRARNPWSEEPVELDPDQPLGDGGDVGPERVAASREALDVIVRAVRARLKERGVELFLLLVVEERPVEEIAEITGMTPGAVYAWHGRFRRMVQEIARELGLEIEALPRKVSESAA